MTTTQRGIAQYLLGHSVTKAKERGWEQLTNGDLLAAAEQAGFDFLLTADKNMRYQQNLTGRKIALLILGNAQWPILRLHLSHVIEAVDASVPGGYVEVEIPFK